MKKIAGLMCLCVFLTGCSAMKPSDFADLSPKLDLFDYFKGDTYAVGIFEDRFGKVRRQFKVDITGTINGSELTLDERFVYDDGETDRRVWYITRKPDGTYEGRADDIIGTATGVVEGNALNWRYDMDLKVGDSSYRVSFNDWMFLQDGEVMINRAYVTKWGIEIGQVSLFFTKPSMAAE